MFRKKEWDEEMRKEIWKENDKEIFKEGKRTYV